jgi:hypothetical protein
VASDLIVETCAAPTDQVCGAHHFSRASDVGANGGVCAVTMMHATA